MCLWFKKYIADFHAAPSFDISIDLQYRQITMLYQEMQFNDIADLQLKYENPLGIGGNACKSVLKLKWGG